MQWYVTESTFFALWMTQAESQKVLSGQIVASVALLV